MKKPTHQDFWGHPYVFGLSPHGKLALSYSLGAELQGESVILEDMATATGIEASECSDWLEQFVAADMLERGTVLDSVL